MLIEFGLFNHKKKTESVLLASKKTKKAISLKIRLKIWLYYFIIK